MAILCSLLLLSALSSVPAFAASGDVTTGTGSTAGSGVVIPVSTVSKTVDATWIDVSDVIDRLRIPEKITDLKAVTTDAAGKNYGFYFASARTQKFAVYRNGRRVLSGDNESPYDLQKPVVFRMTGSGDLLYAVHSTDLYVNNAPVSLDGYSFGMGVGSVHDEGGVLTFPEGGNVVEYDVHTGKRRTLYRHKGVIQFLRRTGKTIAYTLQERGVTRMVRNGRKVTTRVIDNPANFAVSDAGDVYYFAKTARGYALYRNARLYVTGKGGGAFVDLDPSGNVWHLSYIRRGNDTDVRLEKNRERKNLLPTDAANVELSLLFPDGGYAVRAAFSDDPALFQLVRDGGAVGDAFPFAFPYNDTHGLALLGDTVILRAFGNGAWKILADGEPLTNPTFKNPLFFRIAGDALTIYALKR